MYVSVTEQHLTFMAPCTIADMRFAFECHTLIRIWGIRNTGRNNGQTLQTIYMYVSVTEQHLTFMAPCTIADLSSAFDCHTLIRIWGIRKTGRNNGHTLLAVPTAL